MVIRDQMTYIRSRDLGFDRDQILTAPLNGEVRANYEAFRSELLRDPGVRERDHVRLRPGRRELPLQPEFRGRDPGITQVVYMADKEFLATYGLTLLAGRTTSGRSRRRAERVRGQRVECAGSGLRLAAGGARQDGRPGRYAGHHRRRRRGHLPLFPPSPPYAIVYVVRPPERLNYLSVRIGTRNVPATLAHIRKVWRALVPSYPLDYAFLDDSFERLHDAERRMSEMFSVFAFLAIAVACLGLFRPGRLHGRAEDEEIGVRKVLGRRRGACTRR